MKIRKIIFTLLMTLVITSCGKKQEMPESISPQTTEIGGNMGEYYEVVDGSYNLPKITNEFEFDVMCIKNTPDLTYTKLGIGYEIYDEEGKVIDSKNATLEDVSPWKSTDFLLLKEGEMGKVKVLLAGWPEKLKGAKTFKIVINTRGEEGGIATTSEDDASAVASSSSNNWDSVLDEYEQYCTKLASLSKKAMAAEYSSALEQAQRLADKLENAEGEMTSAQVARLNKIASKMAQSVM
ncbi:MAG: hypothetical protein K2M41_08960 [Muribaculaceae bacterium]|nr:hypothetical protein [Muribaculaceae bacterium]